MAAETKADWEQHLKAALKSWHQSMALGQNPLTDLNIVQKQREEQNYADDPLGSAQALRDILRQGIAALGLPNQPAPTDDNDLAWFDPAWRTYAILTLLYVRGLSRGETQQQIGLAEGGQYYKAQRKAIALLAALLREWEGDPEDETAAISLEYPSGAVKLSDTFYIERPSDRDLSYEIVHPGFTISITGPRQVGKTSLLVRAVQAAVKAHQARVVYLDLQTIDTATLEEQTAFLQELAYLIVDELELDTAAVDKIWNGRLAPSRKLTKVIEQVALTAEERPFILVLDEVDRLLLTGYHTDFFGLLRSWHNLRSRNPIWDKFGLLMAISTEPYLLIDDMKQSPFNVGLMVYLDDFSLEQVQTLNGRYQSPAPEEQIPELYDLLGGHPYLTRVAFYTMVKDGLSMAELLETAVSESSPFTAHLRYQRQLLADAPDLQAALAQVLKESKCSDDLARHRLSKAGLIKQQGTAVFCRCSLYRDYFAQTL